MGGQKGRSDDVGGGDDSHRIGPSIAPLSIRFRPYVQRHDFTRFENLVRFNGYGRDQATAMLWQPCRLGCRTDVDQHVAAGYELAPQLVSNRPLCKRNTGSFGTDLAPFAFKTHPAAGFHHIGYAHAVNLCRLKRLFSSSTVGVITAAGVNLKGREESARGGPLGGSPRPGAARVELGRNRLPGRRGKATSPARERWGWKGTTGRLHGMELSGVEEAGRKTCLGERRGKAPRPINGGIRRRSLSAILELGPIYCWICASAGCSVALAGALIDAIA